MFEETALMEIGHLVETGLDTWQCSAECNDDGVCICTVDCLITSGVVVCGGINDEG